MTSKIVPSDASHSEISGQSQIVKTYFQLEAPIIVSSVEAINEKSPEALITLNNPNPAGTSNLVYRIESLNNNPASDWLNYSVTICDQRRGLS